MGLGWYIDRTAQDSKHEFIGSWWGPDIPLILSERSYSTTLEIRRDGTFTKTQTYGYDKESVTFVGTYKIYDDGQIIFKLSNYQVTVPKTEQVNLDVNQVFICRCAVDSYRCLLVTEISSGRTPVSMNRDLNWDQAYYPR